MDDNIIIEPSTIYQFDLGWLAHYETIVFAVFAVLLVAAIIAMLCASNSVKTLCAITLTFIVCTTTLLVTESTYNTHEHRKQRIAAQSAEHRDKIDHAVQTWLNYHGVEHSTFCQNAYSDSVAVHPINVDNTIVCGTGTQESIHVIDDRRVVQATLTQHGTLQLSMIMQ